MDPARYKLIDEAFEQALDAPDPASVLAGLAPDIRSEVEKLLAAEADASRYLKASLEVAALDSADQFGPWRVIGKLGQGGMGTVYKVVRDDGTYAKTAALKVVHVGLDTDVVLDRFRQERQILAQLEHPNIARLIDGGETASKLPYLVLEYVEGLSLTQYSQQQKLTQRRRLELFLGVCSAVAYAHRNLIVHRDLKPSNILVTSDGEVKLLDFGIAKLLDVNADRTQTGFQALTPNYASPEQVSGGVISTASDVYSLGIVLYELLTGRRPYNVETKSVLEIHKTVCLTEAVPPGLGNELDDVVLMAIRKEPARRYHSVEEFAADIRRFLRGEPVAAHPESFVYTAGKFIRRNSWGIAAIAVVVISLTTGLVIARQQTLRAERSFRGARRLANTFLLDFEPKLRKLNGGTESRELLVKTVLQYLDDVSKEGSSDPELQHELARAYDAVGIIQGMPANPNLGHPVDAMHSFQLAVDLYRIATSGSKDPEKLRGYAMAHSHLGRVAAAEGMDAKAVENFQKGLAIAETIPSVAGKEDLPLRAKMNLYFYFGDFQDKSGKLDEALTLMQKSLAATEQQRQLKPSDLSTRDVAAAMVYIAGLEQKLGRLEYAGATLRKAENLVRELLKRSPANSLYLRDLGNLRNAQCTLFFDWQQKNIGDRKAAFAACAENEQLLRDLAEKDKKSISWQEDHVMALIHLAEVKTGVDQAGAASDLNLAQRLLSALPQTITRMPNHWAIWNRANARQIAIAQERR